jgi:hypothetical protein
MNEADAARVRIRTQQIRGGQGDGKHRQGRSRIRERLAQGNGQEEEACQYCPGPELTRQPQQLIGQKPVRPRIDHRLSESRHRPDKDQQPPVDQPVSLLAAHSPHQDGQDCGSQNGWAKRHDSQGAQSQRRGEKHDYIGPLVTFQQKVGHVAEDKNVCHCPKIVQARLGSLNQQDVADHQGDSPDLVHNLLRMTMNSQSREPVTAPKVDFLQ